MRAILRSVTSFAKFRAVWLTAVLIAGTSISFAATEPSTSPVSSSPPSSPLAAVDLPDAPQPNTADQPFATNPHPAEPIPAAISVATPHTRSSDINATPSAKLTTPELDAACQSGTLRGKPCKVKWLPILWEAFESTAYENLGNIAFDSETRHDLANNPYWSTYFKCVHQFRYRQWRDDDNFMVDYVGHGLQGGIVASSFEQHDPKGRGLIYVNNGNYWRSRLKAMAWITVYEVQWKIGPASEASIGNSGLNTYFTPRVHGRSTNETGFQDFVDTPIVGFWWNVGEDALDRFLMPHIWSHTHNRLVLSAASLLTPCKGAANLLRYKPMYYRDFPITPLR
jgi:hypothetical protein